MKKSELVESVASDAGVSKSEAEGVINAFFDTVRSEAKGGNTVGWPGFGKFSPAARPARPARNPRTGATVKVKASTAMKFRQSSVLKSFLNTKGTTRKAPAKSAAAPAGRSTSAAKKASGTSAATKASYVPSGSMHDRCTTTVSCARPTGTPCAATGMLAFRTPLRFHDGARDVRAFPCRRSA